MSAMSPESISDAAEEAHRCKVLIVDDNDVVRMMLNMMLKTVTEFEVVGEAADGRQAVELAHQLEPDVVVLDISMPVMTGMEAMMPLSNLPKPPKVIVHSGYDAVVRDEALAAGAHSFLAKGVRIDELRTAVRDACGSAGCSCDTDAASG